jgi:hypothetical protein
MATIHTSRLLTGVFESKIDPDAIRRRTTSMLHQTGCHACLPLIRSSTISLYVSLGRTLVDRDGVGANLEAWVTNHEEHLQVELE